MNKRNNNSKKYLYIVVEWGNPPIPFRTKTELVKYFDKNDSRIVDRWFKNNWFHSIEKYLVVRVEIPKVKSKIRKK